MLKLLRVAVWGLVALLLIAFGVYTLLYFYFSPERMRPLLEQKISDYLGLKTTVRTMGLDVLPVPSFTAKDIRVETSSGTALLEVASLRMIVIPYIYPEKRLIVAETRLEEPRMSVTRHADGSFSIDSLIAKIREKAQSEAAPKASFMEFGRIILSNADFSYDDETVGGHYEILMNGQVHFTREPKGLEFKVQGQDATHFENPGLFNIQGSVARDTKITCMVENAHLSLLDPYLNAVVPFDGRFGATVIGAKSPGKPWTWLVDAGCKDLTLSDGTHSAGGSLAVSYNKGAGLTVDVDLENARSNARVQYRGGSGKRNFHVTSKLFDHAEIRSWMRMYKEQSLTRKKKFKIKEGVKYEGDIAVDRGQVYKFRFENLNSGITFDGREWAFSSATLKAFGGQIQGDWTVSQNEPVQIKGRWIATGLDAGAVSTTFSSRKITGKADAILRYSGPIGAAVYEGEGVFNFDVTDGTIQNVPVFVKLLAAVNFRTVLDKMMGKDKIEMYAFETIRGVAHLKDSVLDIRKLTLDSDTLEVEAAGKMNFAAETVNAKVSVYALNYVGEILQEVPILKQIYRGKKGIVPISTSLEGSFKDYQIKVVKK